MIDTMGPTAESNLDMIHMLLGGIVALGGVVGALWLFIQKQLRSNLAQTKEFVQNTALMTSALSKNTDTIERNTSMIKEATLDLRDTMHQLLGDSRLPRRNPRP